MLRYLLIFLLLLSPVAVQASPPKVYPVQRVIGFDEPSLEEKAPAFSKWVKSVTAEKLSDGFIGEFKRELGDITTDKISETTRSKVLLASLHLIRASEYSVPKKISQSTEYHLPLTLSIQFTNPATGEVIYSFTRTSYAPVEIHDSEKNTAQSDLLLSNATAANYKSLLAGLIKEAKQGYNPMQVEASVVKIWKKMAILDKGSKFGIGKDDSLEDTQGNVLNVMYVSENYAVASVIGASPEVGTKFSKFANQDTSKAVKKPRVLTMLKGWEDPSLIAISGYFDSELSKESAFTLLPVNESFSTVLQSVAETTNAGKYEITNQRVVPDYLIKFSYSSPRVYEVAQKGKFGYKIYEQYIVGELIDKQGRIIYSSVGSNRIEDKDVGGIVFSKAARLEILLKNATVQLAEQFSKSIKFSSSTLPVTSTNGNIIEIQDVARQIRHNQNVLLYKNIGEINGVIGDVLVPVWEGMVVEKTDEQVRVELLAPVSEEFKTVSISKNDVVLLAALTAGNPPSDSTSMTYCTDIPSKLGAIGIDDFSVISRGFGYLLPYTLYDNDNIFTIKVQNAVRLGGFKVSSLELNKVDTKGRCLLPINKVTVENLNAGECNVTLAIGYRLYTDKEKKGAAAAQMNLVISDLQDGSLNSNIQCEITKNALGLLKDNIMKVQYK